MKPIQIVIHDHSGKKLYSELSYLSSMIPIRQERRGNAIGISDGLIRPVIIIGIQTLCLSKSAAKNLSTRRKKWDAG